MYRYVDAAPLSCPITAFGGSMVFQTTPAAIGMWAKHTETRFEPKSRPGGHFFMGRVRRPQLEMVARDLL